MLAQRTLWVFMNYDTLVAAAAAAAESVNFKGFERPVGTIYNDTVYARSASIFMFGLLYTMLYAFISHMIFVFATKIIYSFYFV